MRFAIVGVGKIGSWLAQTLAAVHEVTVFDCAANRYLALKQVTPVATLDALRQAQPDCVLCATPLHTTAEVLHQLDSLLPRSVVFGDVASLKKQARLFYNQSGRRFVSFHPMFGPTFADMQSLTGEEAVIINESDLEFATCIDSFFTEQGIKTRRLSFREHDRLMMSSLLTPYLSSLLLIELLADISAPGTTLARQREVARGVFSHPTEYLAEIFSAQESKDVMSSAVRLLESLQRMSKEALVERFECARKKLE